MSPLSTTLTISFATLLVLLSGVWLVSLVRRDASVVDIFWGTGFVVVAWLAWRLNPPGTPRTLLLAVLVTLWGCRLSLYLLWRNWGHGEDRRYQAMRAYHGPVFPLLSLITVFWLQGLILWFVALPVQVAAVYQAEGPFGWLDGLGLLAWLVGFVFESVGDWQLARFKANPANRGRVMDQGLWQFTRHPNYFGDFCVWWGLYLIATAGGAGWMILSPLAMSFLLLRVSGVTLLERTIVDRRPEYAHYQARTNAFFPGPPRRLPSTRS